MQLSETIKLYMTKEQKSLVVMTMNEYINTVNSLVSAASNGTPISKYTTADVKASLPSALTNQCIRDAKSIVNRYNKDCRKVSAKNKKPANQKLIFANAKHGTMRIVYKGSKIVAQVVYEVNEPEYTDDGSAMGVDLGIKCPAVSYTSDGSVKFYGNGRKNKYMRRHYKYLRKKLGKAKKPDAIKRINNKEQRIMKDIDHKISREIVETAVVHDVKVIKLERLANIRSTTRTSRKNNPGLHTWPFYRLAQFIEYKAKLAGIKVEYVNPAYTSQRCPVCGSVHHAKDRNYTCSCVFRIHRDLLGAINICNSTEYVGDRNIRHTA